MSIVKLVLVALIGTFQNAMLLTAVAAESVITTVPKHFCRTDRNK